MKNCNLLNRIVPRAYQSPGNFTNGSAESLGTKLLYGHAGTIGKPVIARRNNHRLCAVAQLKESFFHGQPRAERGKSSCKIRVHPWLKSLCSLCSLWQFPALVAAPLLWVHRASAVD